MSSLKCLLGPQGVQEQGLRLSEVLTPVAQSNLTGIYEWYKCARE